jgi:hypothetical protein
MLLRVRKFVLAKDRFIVKSKLYHRYYRRRLNVLINEILYRSKQNYLELGIHPNILAAFIHLSLLSASIKIAVFKLHYKRKPYFKLMLDDYAITCGISVLSVFLSISKRD